jgi:hypothetical protein
MDVTPLPGNPAAISFVYKDEGQRFYILPLSSGLPFQSLAHKFYKEQKTSLASVRNSNINAIAMKLFFFRFPTFYKGRIYTSKVHAFINACF